MHLTYVGNIPAAELVGRIMGPDTASGYSTVTGGEYVSDLDVTRATLRPSVLDTDVVFDGFGQMWRHDRG